MGGFDLEPFVTQTQEFVVIAGKGKNLPTIEFDNAGGQFAQQSTVVGDEYHGATPAQQEFLEMGDGVEVEVVSGLVEEQHVGRGGKGPGKERAALEATG